MNTISFENANYIKEITKDNVNFYWEATDCYPTLEVFRHDSENDIQKIIEIIKSKTLIFENIEISFERLEGTYYRIMILIEKDEQFKNILKLSEILKYFGSSKWNEEKSIEIKVRQGEVKTFSIDKIAKEVGFSVKEVQQGYTVFLVYEGIEVIQKIDCIEVYGLGKFDTDIQAGEQALKDGLNLFTIEHEELEGWYIIDSPENRQALIDGGYIQ